MDFLNLVAKITLDQSEYDTGLRGLAGKAGKTLGTVAKVGAAAIAAGGAAVVAVTKQAIDGYAEYEQLTGGIQTLYGEGSKAADDMMKHASEAWKTSGMSANEYMTTAIESSAALINALGGDTEKAAEMMDMSITDMSDNVNKMGTSMEAIQNAYRGFSRGNFTMLDNLALGFAGTKEGMQQLLDKAKEYAAQNGEIRDFSIDSYADIVDAIHIVQTEMGITGTTAKEAKDTISGSINSMKAAWHNLVTGLADENANIEQLIDDLLVTIIGENGEGGVINNIMPAVERALNGIVKLITTIIPKITPIITDLISQNLPVLVEAGMQLLIALISGIVQGLPQLIETLPVIFETIKTVFMENWPALREAGAQLLQMIGEGIISALGLLDEKLAEVGIAISTTIDNKWLEIKQASAEIWNGIKESLANTWNNIKDKASETWENLLTAASEKWTAIKDSVSQIGENIKTAITDTWENIKQTVSDKIEGLLNAVRDKFENIRNAISDKISAIRNLFNFEWSFPHIRLPHFSWSWTDLGFGLSIPHISVDWYKKAYETPYMFTKPTVMGFGDGVGGEMVYGHDSLMKDIKEAVGDMSGGITVNVYPQKGQSEEEIARKVEQVLTRWDRQRKAAFA